MDTISTIVGPSITRLWPLVGVGGSLASDWVRFLELNRLFDNVWTSSGAILSFCCLDIGNSFMYMYIQDQWTLSAPF